MTVDAVVEDSFLKAEREAEAAEAQSQPEAGEQLSILVEEPESAEVAEIDAEIAQNEQGRDYDDDGFEEAPVPFQFGFFHEYIITHFILSKAALILSTDPFLPSI